ncbi:MAG: sigma-70 family RNA polymerase sigma factor [Rhodospirillales bacterium]|nr:sigma-70 family RNA polymerase sigma factor [Rhodospirillales bacterium]
MRLAQGGDRAAYKRLLEEITPRLRRMVQRNRAFLQPQDIDDLVQNILLALHSARATYDPCRPFLPWLMAIARNQIADGARRYARRVANEVIVWEVPETFSGNGAKSHDEAYGDREALSIAIGALPRGQRRAIEMLKLKEMTLKEAAAASGMSVPALKVAVHRAMRALRKALSRRA